MLNAICLKDQLTTDYRKHAMSFREFAEIYENFDESKIFSGGQ